MIDLDAKKVVFVMKIINLDIEILTEKIIIALYF